MCSLYSSFEHSCFLFKNNQTYIFAVMFPFLNKFMTITVVKKEVHEFFTAAVRSALEIRKSGVEVYRNIIYINHGDASNMIHMSW